MIVVLVELSTGRHVAVGEVRCLYIGKKCLVLETGDGTVEYCNRDFALCYVKES